MADIVHVNPKGSWKKVKIDPNLFPQSDLDGLISLEELTDYDIVKSNEKGGNKSSEKKKKKKVLSEPPGVKETSSETISKVKKKLKKKQKKQKQHSDSENPKTNTSESGEDVLDGNKVRETESETGNVKRKKKKIKIDNKTKTGKAVKQKGFQVVDVAEELEKFEPADKSIGKKRKKSGTKTTEASPLKKPKLEKPVRLPNVADTTKGMEAWKDLFVPAPVLTALKENGFTYPTPIQAQVLPPAIRDKLDILGAAETGSGKTLAFGIALIHYILEEKRQCTEETVHSFDDSGTEENESADELVETVDKDTNDENSDSGMEHVKGDDGLDDTVEDDDDDGSDYDEENANDSPEDDDVHSDNDDFDTGDDHDADLEGKADDDSSSEEEELEDLGDEEKGCVKVIKDVDFSWMNPETSVTTKSTRTHPRALILEPTRELAIQVKNHLMAAAKYSDLSVAVIVGGLSMQKQRRILKRCPDVIVATPGRLWELVQEGEGYLSRIEETRHLVVDEADRMVEKGHFEELTKLLRRMNVDETLRKRRHTYVFSATLTLLHSGPQRVMKKKKKVKLDENQKLELLMKSIGLKDKPKVIDLTRKVGTVETLTEARINCSTEEKDVYLYYFLKQYPGRTLVFTNSKDCIRRLVSIFTLLQCNPLPLHADMHQRQRLKNLDRFSANPNGFLLASDVAARGLDILNVEHVIHYQVPHSVENYVHRSGRTARASKEGLSVVLIGPQDLKNYRKIMHSLNKSEDLPMFPVEQEYLSEVKRRVKVVRQIETQEYRFNKKKHQNDWFRKAAEEIGVDIEDENLLNDLGDDSEQAKHRQYIKQMKTELAIMLKQPILPLSFGGKYPTKSGKLATLLHRDTEKDAIKQVKKDKKVQDRMKARDALKPRLSRPMKQKKSKWKKKKRQL